MPRTRDETEELLKEGCRRLSIREKHNGIKPARSGEQIQL
jgi:hypothetical protein